MKNKNKGKFQTAERKRKTGKSTLFMALALTMHQITVAVPVTAEELVYEGTTQMEAVDEDFSLDEFATAMVVEEVYVEAGNRVEAGAPVLKLTSDSYQEALDYYEAAVIRADNALTDTQLEYDQGVLEAKYEYETAKTTAEQAEFVRAYQQNELEKTIAAHEEMKTDLEDKITEVETGIANGSYGSTQFGGGASGSGGQAAGFADKKDDTEAIKETETETESEEPETETPGTEGTEPETETPGTEGTEPETETPGTETQEPEQQIALLKQQLEENAKTYHEILTQIDLIWNTPVENETEASEDSSDGETAVDPKKKLQEALEGDTQILGHLKNVQEMVDDVPEPVLNAAALAGIDYEKYTELLEDCIEQMEKNVEAQTAVLAVLSGMDEEEPGTGSMGQELRQLLEQWSQCMEAREKIYSQIVTLEETQIANRQQEITRLQTLLEQNSNEDNSGMPGQNGDGDNSQMPGQNGEPNNSQMPGQNGGPNNSQISGGNQLPSISSTPNMGGSAGGGSFTGMSGAAGSITLEVNGAGGSSMTMEDLNLTEEDISLFGDTYDLSRMESLLEQEPSDSDSAQEFLEELEAAADTVEKQHRELVRDQKITELDIQYTYETSVLAGELAEITYAQELQEWEDTLAAAKETKSELEAKKQVLENMTEGVISAACDGTIAAVNYETGDVLNESTPVLSMYDTSEVTVTIVVPQEEIAQIQVGDTMDVTLAARDRQTGTVQEKSPEPQEGTSRTTVNYEVIVAIENKEGRLGAGMSAEVTIPDADAGETVSEEENHE